MQYFLPDQESLREVFGAYMDKGLRFELKPDSYFGCYALRVRFAEGSTGSPLLPLWPEKMQTPEAAQQWLEHLRDGQLAMITRGAGGVRVSKLNKRVACIGSPAHLSDSSTTYSLIFLLLSQ